MGPEHKQHNDAIDRVLGALRDAAPPAGMETRIAQRLAHDSENAQTAQSRWHGFYACLTPQSQWLRGAITGVAVASLAFGVFLFATRPARTPSQNGSIAQTGGSSSQHGTSPQTVRATPISVRAEAPAGQSGNPLCGNPALMRTRGESAPSRAGAGAILRAASFAPSQPAPPAPLTAQERALLQLARTANPAALAALDPAAEQKAEAEREAAFNKFFAPSPELIAAEKAEEEATRSAGGEMPQPTEVQN